MHTQNDPCTGAEKHCFILNQCIHIQFLDFYSWSFTQNKIKVEVYSVFIVFTNKSFICYVSQSSAYQNIIWGGIPLTCTISNHWSLLRPSHSSWWTLVQVLSSYQVTRHYRNQWTNEDFSDEYFKIKFEIVVHTYSKLSTLKQLISNGTSFQITHVILRLIFPVGKINLKMICVIFLKYLSGVNELIFKNILYKYLLLFIKAIYNPSIITINFICLMVWSTSKTSVCKC